jgi:hypothetical protein
MQEKVLEKKISSLFHAMLTTSVVWKPTEEELAQLRKVGQEEFLVEKILSRRYRKSGVDINFRNKIREKALISFRNNIPIRLILPFGGYKANASYSQANWAEFFNLAMIIEYISPIASLFLPGVVIEYCSDGAAMGMLNNIPLERIYLYSDSFIHLLSQFIKNLPSNVSINFSMSNDQYDNFEHFWSEVKSTADELNRNWFSHLASQEKSRLLEKANRNFNWKGVKDFTALTGEEKQDKLINSVCLHNAYVKLDDIYRYNFIQGKERIPISTRKGYEGWLHLGSCRASIVQFWIGQGIIDTRNTKLIPKIYSSTQIKNENFLDINVLEVLTGENFHTIQVIK